MHLYVWSISATVLIPLIPGNNTFNTLSQNAVAELHVTVYRIGRTHKL